MLSSNHRELAQVRALAEAVGIPVRWIAQRDKMPSLHQIREIRRFLQRLGKSANAFSRASELKKIALEMFGDRSTNPWVQFLIRLLDDWKTESADAELPAFEASEFLNEICAESRREFSFGDGVTLSTVHAGKGTEYDHVLIVGTWAAALSRAKLEESRRAFYVGMTRARNTLAVFDRLDVRPSLPSTLTGPAIIVREHKQEQESTNESVELLNYETLGLEDIHLGFPGRFPENSEMHLALGRLNPGDKLTMLCVEGSGIGLFDRTNVCVARLSHKAEESWINRLQAVREIRVLAMISRGADQDAEQTRRDQYRISEWEIPLVEIVFMDGR